MNGSAPLTDESALRLLIEVPGNPAMIWRMPSTGLVLGSALGCDIRLPSEFPPVLLTVFPAMEGTQLSARIRPMAPLLEIRHGGKEWQGGILSAGNKVQIGSLFLGVLNASTQLQPPVIAQGESYMPIQHAVPPASSPALQSEVTESKRPKKKISWLRRWQRSLELRETALFSSQSWGPPPVAPEVQPQQVTPISADSGQIGPGDPKWRELEERIQTARAEAEACALEKVRLQQWETQLALREELLRKGQVDLESAWAQFHQTDRITRNEWHEGLVNLELARKALATQAASLEAYRLQLEVERTKKLESQLLHEATTQPEAPTPVPALVETPHPETVSPPKTNEWTHQGSSSSCQEALADSAEMNAQITSLWNQLAANQINQAPSESIFEAVSVHEQVTETDLAPLPPFVETAIAETGPESLGSNQNALSIHSMGEETFESVSETLRRLEETTAYESGEDLENFLPPPDELQLEAFRHWCHERLQNAAQKIEEDPANSSPADSLAEDHSHRHGFGRKLLEQGIATPHLLAPFTRLANRRGVALEDILTRLEVFTTHQIATMGLGCANDLVLGRWFILDLPGADSGQLDRELVFRVFDPVSKRSSILRILTPGEAGNSAKAADYRARNEACARLDSEHLIANLEVTDLNGLPCVIQEEWTGTSFESWPSMGGSATVWYRLFLQAVIALRDLHQAGLHHGYLGTRHFLLKSEGLLRLTGHATPLWLAANAEGVDRGPTGDITDLARIGQIWWAGPNGENQRQLPESLAGVLARMEQDHPEAIKTSKSLAEELDRAGILLPSGAVAWKHFLDEFSGPEPSNEEADEEGPEDAPGPYRRTA